MFINPSAASWSYEGPSADPGVAAFHRSLPDYNVTTLHSLPRLASELGIGHVLLKDESDRFGLPAFKILGASWATYKVVATHCNLPLPSSLEELGQAARDADTHIVTCTAGNWGRAVARMAKYLHISVTVFVPNTMDKATQDKISNEGARVTVVDGDYDETILVARKQAGNPNSIFMMDTSWEGYEDIPQWVVEGYSTMLTETDEQLQDRGISPVTHAIASVGVGSWAQAVAMRYKCASRTASVIAVEPDTAACLKTSLESGKITPISTGNSIMNGMNCGTVSYTAWKVLQNGVDASIQVSDTEAHSDVQYLHSQGIEVGPCGAAPLSALRTLVKEGTLNLGENSVVVLFSTEGARDYEIPTGLVL